MTPVDVRLDGVGKQYRLGTARSSASFWALSDVTLDVERGACVGIIGRNGAGKSTLLKLLAGITAPSRGSIRIEGVLSALIEVGSGFHPELTGRENVFLSGSLLGLRRRDIAARLDAIVAFAGVERFVDTPVKWYSSGMYVRLGFAIAAHLQPDILLVDEVLAVGDSEFQVRCLDRIEALRRSGTTILFISHDLSTVERLCDRVVLLDRGAVVLDGRAADVVSHYHAMTTAPLRPVAADDHPVYRARLVRIAGLAVSHEQTVSAARTGDPLLVQLRVTAERTVAHLAVHIVISSAEGTRIATLSADTPHTVPAPVSLIELAVPACPLQAGRYQVMAELRDARTDQVLDWWDGGTVLHVTSAAMPQPGLMHVSCPSHVLAGVSP